MSTRRKFLTESGVMALGSILFSERMAVADDAITTEEQKGDPDVPYEEVAYSPIFMQRLVSSSKKAQFGSWSKAFPERFISAAQKFVGVNRSDNQNQISDFLALFNLPFSNSHGPNAFCASGLG